MSTPNKTACRIIATFLGLMALVLSQLLINIYLLKGTDLIQPLWFVWAIVYIIYLRLMTTKFILRPNKKPLEPSNTLSYGTVTQNGYYISYKTNMYSDYNSFFQKLHYELTEFLNEKGIKYVKKDFRINKAENSRHRKGCITISVESTDQTLPFSSDSVN